LHAMLAMVVLACIAGSCERGGAIAEAVASAMERVALRRQGTLASSRLVGLVMVTTKV